MDVCTQYAKDVVAGKEPAGDYVLWTCQRHLDDIKKSKKKDFPFYFDESEAERIRGFASVLIQFEGDFAGKPLDLLPWQAFVFGCVYGWKIKASKLRRFRTAYVEVPRKNGKTTCAIVPVLYAMLVEAHPSAQIYALATKQDQAKLLWNGAKKVIKGSKGLTGRITDRHNRMFHKTNGSEFKPLGSDSDTLDGLNPYLAVCDELHAWKGRELWDVIVDGMGSQAQPLMFAITTAGYNQTGICYTQRSHGVAVLDPEKWEYEDDRFFAYIATCKESSRTEWDKESTWIEANPSLGTAKRLDYLEAQAAEARQIPSKRNAFLNKQLNIWTTAAEHWLDLHAWDKCAAAYSLEDMRNEECYAGIDLAKVGDVSSVCYVFPPTATREKWRLLATHYVPEDDIRERSKKVPYDTWRAEGMITATPGNVTDFDFIRADMARAAEIVRVRAVPYDRMFAHELITHLKEDGFDCVSFSQGFGSMAAPTAELERMIMAGEIEHNGCRVLRWMAGNAVVVKDSYGNIRPDKSKSEEKIDGIVAAIMGIGEAMTNETAKSPYETRGIRTI